MIAYWSRDAMHKGKITMRGRIMAGSQAVIAHNEAGHAVCVEYHTPDIHLSQLIVAYCQKVVEATGSALFVIDRAVNSLAMAAAFAKQYWGTPKVQEALAPTEWPRVYRERTERQENSFKRMIDHGALEINYGRKKIIGPDRHQQRKREQLDASLATAQQRVDKKVEALAGQQVKVAESKSKGHGQRLEQRQQALARVEQELKGAQHHQAQLAQQFSALGAPRERADRDFRKQTIMTCRTLLLENALMAFMAVLLGHLQSKVSLGCVLHILFERSGACVETSSEIIYWVNTAGLSVHYRRLLKEVVDGLCAMDLRDQGKPIRVCLKDLPP